MSIKFNGQLLATHDGRVLTLQEGASWSDFARSHQINNNLPDELLDNATRVFELLKAAYAKLGCGAEVTSFFRCPQLNVAIGGKVKPPSAHMDGRAIDSVPVGVGVQEAFNILKGLVDELGFDQLIIEHDRHGNIWLHMSIAPSGKDPRKMAFALEKDPVAPRVEKG